MRRLNVPALVLVLLAALLTSCDGAEGQTCISWAIFEDDAARTETADMVIEAVVLERAGERRMFGARGAVWDIEVLTVLKGDVAAGDRLAVASTPRTCEGHSVYPDGDPLDTHEPLLLFLTDSDFGVERTDGGLALITPFDGVQSTGTSS